MAENRIDWPMAVVISVIMLCAALMFMSMVVTTHPFEISFKSDENVVDISDNFRRMSEAVSQSQGDLMVCQAKLEYYQKIYEDPWGVN